MSFIPPLTHNQLEKRAGRGNARCACNTSEKGRAARARRRNQLEII
jgi:hypothetical protein